jgi:trimeric autotransporter adhesin
MKTLLHLFCFSLVFSSFVFFSNVSAQTAPLEYYLQSYDFDSGVFDGDGTLNSSPTEIYLGVIEFHNIPWLQIHFSDVNLGDNSYLIMTSLYDNKWQKLDAVSMNQWNNYSAFFNGGAVELKLILAQTDRQVYIKIDEISIGEWYSGEVIESQCGPTDDRIASNQPATARLVSIGCTAWIIPNGKFATAGHCLDGSGANIVEFNVPLSLPSGTIQHPDPEDQYSVDVSTKIFTNGGIGNDWGVFEVFPNSITGLMPKQAQNAYWPLVQDYGPDSIRITGYGVDGGTANQTQQTHIGPNAGSSSNTMRYVTDTEGGNSGSPVIDGLTNVAVGVHTHGGCNSTGGNNNGTSTFHPAFWAAVDMGAGGCPVELPSNPNPTNGQTDIPLNLSQLTWSNGTGALTNELYFGTNPSSLNLVQSGTLATSWTITGVTLTYGTNYYWKVVEVGDTCNSDGPVWNFKTVQSPYIVIDTVIIHPQSTQMWTGTTEGTTKTDGEINTVFPNVGWAAFDLSGFPTSTSAITSIEFFGYVNATNWPYWSSTPMGTVNPITAAAGDIYSQVNNNTGSGVAYIFSDEPSTFAPGWHNYMLEAGATTDMFNSLSQGWFAMGFIDRDASATYFVNFDGWSQPNPAYLIVVYEYMIPVELTSFSANASESLVELSWITATETNNQGFEVQRSAGGEFETIAFINGHGTTTETQAYSYSDRNVNVGSYSYKLKQVDFDGTYEYSNVIEVDVPAPAVFTLEQNYPNPFNPSTKIRFSIPVETDVRLNVYNTLGQEVAEIVNSRLKEGYHEVNFDAVSLTSGIYFYRLEADKFVEVKKMIILK